MVKYNFTIENVTAIDSFVISNFHLPIYKGGFNRDAFWDEFLNRNSAKDELELLTLLLDITRCHWGPRSQNWPGMEIVANYNNGANQYNIVLDSGKTRVAAFDKGKGVYNWTGACLATAAIFEEVYRQNENCDTTTINGSWNGATQNMSTLDGYTLQHFKSCQGSFKTWINSIGAKQRDSKVDVAITTAVTNTISNRSKANSAYSIKNAFRYLTGAAFVEADQISFVEATP